MDDKRLIKIVLLGIVEGNRPCGRPARRWSDDIVDWCGYVSSRVRSTSERQTELETGEKSMADMGHELNKKKQ